MNASPLHLVRLRVDARALSTFAARHGLLDDDLGYALHLALRRRFGHAGPQPFRRMSDDGTAPASDEITLLAYSRDVAQLEKSFNDMPAIETDGERTLLTRMFPLPPESRRMPENWSSAPELDFEIVVRPVRRHGSKVRNARREDGEASPGSEHDAFLSAVRASDDGDPAPERESVYAKWLSERLAPAAAIVGDCHLVQFRRTRLRRSLHSRGRTRAIEGPEALMKGRLRITDPEAFDTLLGKGVGRHSAFGFGMLLLAPARD